MGRGALIVFEGADRSGKTTQTQRCVEALRSAGVNVVEGAPWRFPNRNTSVGQSINAYLKQEADMEDHALHLLFAANRWEQFDQTVQALNSGATVVVDRYAYSGVAYSAAKGLRFDWCMAPDAGLPAPDLTIYLELPPGVARTRGGYGQERYEHETFQTLVAQQFRNFEMREEWNAVDANASVDTVFEKIMQLALPTVIRVKNDDLPLRWLW